MTIKDRINNFSKLDAGAKLDSWKELISIGQDYLNSKSKDLMIAKEIALIIYRHRGIMGSSKAYESAYEIEIELVKLQLPIARIAFGKSKELIPFLNDALYYADFSSDDKLKSDLREEINSIQKNNG